jgi:ATP-dependent Clp protease adaptor protein ClpS
MPMTEAVPQPITTPERTPAQDTALEPLYRVLIHNDDATPYEYVILILETVFMLSGEMAEHVTWVAHTEGQAVVVVRPRPEAERLVNVAHGRARGDGFPLTFTLEPE